MSDFGQFLLRNNVQTATSLPLVHSTPALHLKSIVQSGQISTNACDVFAGDALNYFFVGRPAYKRRSDVSDSPYWELPCCFIFEFSSLKPFRRVFPFDSGAFQRYPSYLKSFAVDKFDVAAIPDATERIVGAFFGDAQSYFRLSAKPTGAFESEHSLGPFDYEVKALHRLALEQSAASFDDRRLTVEVQTETSVDLVTNKPLAVVAPAVFFDDQSFLDHVTNVWQAQPISYPIFALNTSAYYAAIYERVEVFYRSLGLLP